MQHYRDKIAALAEAGKYSATVAAGHSASRPAERPGKYTCRAKPPNRPGPGPNMFALESHIVSDSYLVTKLAPAEGPSASRDSCRQLKTEARLPPPCVRARRRQNLISEVDDATRRMPRASHSLEHGAVLALVPPQAGRQTSSRKG